MLNVNYGRNAKLLEACKPLGEYAWFVDTVRRKRNGGKELEAAIDATLDEMPEDYIMRPFLTANRAEVKAMYLTEYDQEKAYAAQWQDGLNEGTDSAYLKSIRSVMEFLTCTAEEAMEILKIPQDQRAAYAERL